MVLLIMLSALGNALKGIFQKHLPSPPPPSIKKHIWHEGWTDNAVPADVAQEMIKADSVCYSDLEVVHLPSVYDSTTGAGQASITAMTGLTDPSGPKRYFFLGLLLSGVRVKPAPGQQCPYDSEL